MKRTFRFGLVGLMIESILAQTSVTLVADQWCPYNCEPDAARPGYAIEIATEVFAKHGVDVQYQLIPWTRAVEMTRSGHFDAIVGAIPIEAEDFLFGAEPIGQVRHTLYTTADSPWSYQSITSLPSIRLGAIQDYSYGPDLTAYIETHREDSSVSVIGGTDALNRLIQMLAKERIDVLVEDRTVMNYHLSMSSDKVTPELREAGTAAADFIYIAFSPSTSTGARYQQWLDDGIRGLRDSGRLSEILTHYGLEDWQ